MSHSNATNIAESTSPSSSRSPHPDTQPSSRPATATYKFITDNPYRLLSLGSSESPRTVRLKAVAAAQATKVGLPSNVSLLQEFGDQELVRCDDLARQIASSPVTRTLYRQMWPYVLTRRIESAADLPPTFPFQGECAEAFSGRMKDIFGIHLSFLRNWFLFVGNDQPARLADAMGSFGKLYDSDSHETYLRDALVNEGESSDTAENSVIEAQNDLATHLLRFASERAVQMLDRQDYESFGVAIKGIRGCSLDKRNVHQVLSAIIVPYGNREMERAQAAARAANDPNPDPSWQPAWESYSGGDVQPLFELARLLPDFPSAPLWQQAAQTRIDQVASLMFQRALTLAETYRDYTMAQTLLSRVRALPLSSELEEHINSNAGMLTAMGRKRAASRSDEPQAISAAPTLLTWNGIGTKLYGHGDFETHPAWHRTTLYFTILFLPILPLKHYLVSNADKKRINFHASLPFHIGHKIHLAIGAVVALAIIFSIATAPPSTSSDTGTTGSASSASTPSDSATTDTNSSDVSSSDSQNAALAAQAQSLRQQLDAQLPLLQQEKRKVDIEQSALEAQFTRWQQTHDQVDADRKILNNFDPRAVEQFNASVGRANAALGDYNAAVKVGHDHIAAFNAETDAFHAKEQQYNNLVDRLNSSSSQ